MSTPSTDIKTRKRVIRATNGRTIREVLRDRSALSMAGEIAGAALALIATIVLATNVGAGLTGVTTIATKAERQTFLTALVADRHEGASWGSLTAPTTQMMTMPNGARVQVTTWREDGPASTRLSATMATSSTSAAVDCTKPSNAEKSGCVYASSLHASELDSIKPHAITRLDPSMIERGTPALGTVNDAVGRGSALTQGETIATGTDSAAAWRYLVTARSLANYGELRIAQDGKTLAVVPVDAEAGNYYGTLAVAPGAPVTITVSAGDVIVDTVYLYRAGASA